MISAALVSLFGYYVTNTFSLDSVVLPFSLLALLTLLGAKTRNSSLLALLSGLLLEASILTKETAFANLPLTMLALLLLDGDLRTFEPGDRVCVQSTHGRARKDNSGRLY
jgi:4-amino-4-deoxy-L-arabinose transferase-like glycosyltransferase